MSHEFCAGQLLISLRLVLEIESPSFIFYFLCSQQSPINSSVIPLGICRKTAHAPASIAK